MYSIGVTSSTKTRLIALRHSKDGCLKIEIKLSIECRMLVKFKIAFSNCNETILCENLQSRKKPDFVKLNVRLIGNTPIYCTLFYVSLIRPTSEPIFSLNLMLSISSNSRHKLSFACLLWQFDKTNSFVTHFEDGTCVKIYLLYMCKSTM